MAARPRYEPETSAAEQRTVDAAPRPAKVRSYQPADFGLGPLFDHLLDAVVIAHLSTNTIVLWNLAAEKLFGFTAAEAVGQSIDILIPPAMAPLHRAGLERYLRTGHGLIVDADGPVEIPSQHKNGQGLRIELALSEIRDENGERFGVAFIHDAMSRKRLELTHLELVQARVARSEAEIEIGLRDKMLDDILALLQGQPSADELRSMAQAVHDFRRLQGGHVDVQLVEGDLAAELASAVERLRGQASRRVFVHSPKAVAARFDVERTQEIFAQVFDEALRRSSGGSLVEVRLEQPTSRSAHVTVRVQGTGVTRSLGVGLHVSQLMMQRQGGTLTSALTANGGLQVVLTFAGCPPSAGAGRGRRSTRRRAVKPEP